jgi:hypothetical protein
MEGFEQIQGLFGVNRGMDVVALLAEKDPGEFQVDGSVIDYQDGFARHTEHRLQRRRARAIPRRHLDRATPPEGGGIGG